MLAHSDARRGFETASELVRLFALERFFQVSITLTGHQRHAFQQVEVNLGLALDFDKTWIFFTKPSSQMFFPDARTARVA